MTTRKTPRKPPPTRRLDTDLVVQAALEVAEKEGVDAISMRVVADKIGVTPMALYRHVETKEDLVKLVADAVIGQVEVPKGLDPAQWREALLALLADYRTRVQRYPGLSAVVLHGGLLPNSRRNVAVGLDLLTSAGFNDEEAMALYAGFHLLLMGRLNVDEARRTRAQRAPGSHHDKRIDTYLTALQDEETFMVSLQRLLDATPAPRAQAARQRTPLRRPRA